MLHDSKHTEVGFSRAPVDLLAYESAYMIVHVDLLYTCTCMRFIPIKVHVHVGATQKYTCITIIIATKITMCIN